MTAVAPRILVVEDDRSLREGLAMNLRRKGYDVELAVDGTEGMEKAFGTRPDLVILDVMMPGFSGLDILDELRSRKVSTPVLVLSARGRLDQRVEGLKLGADDYLAKPFDLAELLARVEALLRRSGWQEGRKPAIRVGALCIDLAARRVTRGEQEIALSAKEFELLALLAGASGQSFTRARILERVWGWDFDGTERTVDNFVLSLRRKVEENPARPQHIVTVRQVGYRFEP
jgi:two-component system alkaline phosphatase synthesis response regulator PhoP